MIDNIIKRLLIAGTSARMIDHIKRFFIGTIVIAIAAFFVVLVGAILSLLPTWAFWIMFVGVLAYMVGSIFAEDFDKGNKND